MSNTLKTGVGFVWSLKAVPDPKMVENISPTIWVPAGTNIVLETLYVPASKTVIKQLSLVWHDESPLHSQRIPQPAFFKTVRNDWAIYTMNTYVC